MADKLNNFIRLAEFYNMLTTVMSAVCVRKGGIAMENYVGRFAAADVLEFISEYGARLEKDKTPGLTPNISALIARFAEEYAKVKSLTTSTNKPIHEMTLEEFEKLMNI